MSILMTELFEVPSRIHPTLGLASAYEASRVFDIIGMVWRGYDSHGVPVMPEYHISGSRAIGGATADSDYDVVIRDTLGYAHGDTLVRAGALDHPNGSSPDGRNLILRDCLGNKFNFILVDESLYVRWLTARDICCALTLAGMTLLRNDRIAIFRRICDA